MLRAGLTNKVRKQPNRLNLAGKGKWILAELIVELSDQIELPV